jgi:hypothetical protein
MSTQANKTSLHALRIPPSPDDPTSMGQQMVAIHKAQVNLPYPPPQIISQYNQVEPGLGTKVIELIDRENLHRHECEKRSLDADIATRNIMARNERLAIWAEDYNDGLGSGDKKNDE